MSYAKLCSYLVHDSWWGLNGLTMKDIAEMTDYQKVEIYFRKRDDEEKEKGRASRPAGEPMSCYQQLYMKVWLLRGMTKEQIRQKWDDDLAAKEHGPDGPWDDKVQWPELPKKEKIDG
jgi:hypothetical protein